MIRKRYRVHVTAVDILESKRGNSFSCMAAHAVVEQVKGASRPMVDMRTTRFTVDGVRLVYQTPVKLAQYVVDYDMGKDIEPFSFTLENPKAHKTRPGRDRATGRVPNPMTPSEASKAEKVSTVLTGTDGSTTSIPVVNARDTAKVAFGKEVRVFGAHRLRISRKADGMTDKEVESGARW